MTKRIKKTTREILLENRKKTSPLSDFVLMAHDIRSLHNVGSLFRTADVFGIQLLLLSGFTSEPPRPEITKTALGAEQHVRWKKTRDPIGEIAAMKSRGYRMCGLEQTFQSIQLHEYRPKQEKTCLLLGNEVTGIDDRLIPLMDDFVEIPQFGEKHSLNVSVAAGVAMYAFCEKALWKRS